MESTIAAAPAAFGSLDREVAQDLELLRDFVAARDRQMRRLFGRAVRRSATRDELVRSIVLAFAEDRLLRVSSCIQLCSGYATAPTVRSELALMVEAGLVVLQDDSGTRSPSVRPTSKLIAFYNGEIPRLRATFLKLLLDVEHPREDRAHC